MPFLKMETPEKQLEILSRGAAQILSAEELLAKLRLGRPLNVKLGVDPTAPDIHLGFTVALQKLRQFQDLGHNAVLIIGDFTAMIGDPSGRSAARPQLSHDQVMDNARTFQQQAYKILDPVRTRTVFNGEWLEMMTFDEVIKLTSRVTMQQMLHRDDFRNRIDEGTPVHLHETIYPIIQGWDSVKVRADVELGGTDQLFNIMVGRQLQKEEGQAQQVALLVPLLVGLDGVQKMSKSYGNYVGVAEAPGEMFGKLMSISDETMATYYSLLLGEDMPAIHPMDAKKQLASRIVARFHSQADADAALADFNTRFSKRDLDHADLPDLGLDGIAPDIISIVVAAYAHAFQITKSRGDVRRLVEQGSIHFAGEKFTDVKATPDFSAGGVLRLDKTHAVRIG